jgi:hypothetical protein
VIVVYTDDEAIGHEDATRYSNDEHNNLCLWTGDKGDELLELYSVGYWKRVEVVGDEG